MDRRLLLMGGAVWVGGLRPAHANPLAWAALRFLFSLGGRLAVRSAARSAVGGAARLAARRSIAVANSRLARSGVNLAAAAITFRSDRLLQQYEQHEPGILVIQQEPAQVFIESNASFETNILCSIVDYDSGRTETKESIYASGDAGRKSEFIIQRLPFTGIKRLHGVPEVDGLNEFYSDKFMVVSKDDVEIG